MAKADIPRTATFAGSQPKPPQDALDAHSPLDAGADAPPAGLGPNPLRPRVLRLVRYAATSGIALGISEATLLLIYATGAVSATVAAIFANLVGTVPSYLMSRYWIWKDSQRARVGRQIVLYWTTSAISMAGTSVATGLLATLSPRGRTIHLVVVGVGFLFVNFVFWVAKYVVYQRVIFRPSA